ncbi:MAG: FAD-binding protein [Smithellaceae bacterium]|nr:FAD-binding protein [Smithellaceae bacterium]
MKAPGKDIWVHMDLRDERLFGYSLNCLAKAKELAGTSKGCACAVLVGAFEDRTADLDAQAKDCIAHGADIVYVIDHRELVAPRADVHAAVLAQAIAGGKPLLVIFALTDWGRELAARAARILNAGLIADAVDFRLEGGNVVASCPSWGGEIMAEITYGEDEQIRIATAHPHISQAQESAGSPGDVKKIPLDDLPAPSGLRLISRVAEAQEHRKLEEAETVVVGGAGLGSIDGFTLVRDLAVTLGGEVGATRPPVMQHWVEEERLVGQTGKTIRPQLLLTVATSGAIQYTAGITEAKTVVAINADRGAPIFQAADIGVVADAKVFVPLLTARIKQKLMRRLADTLASEKGEGRESFGAKIKKLREANGWTVSMLAQATGQTPEFIAEVEEDSVAPPVSFLLGLADALKVDKGTFLKKEEKAAIRDQRAQAFIKRTQNYSYQTLTPDAEAGHLRAFMITIEPKQTHKAVAYKHEGEEFIYVLEGVLELTLSNKAHRLGVSESICFNSNVPHKLKSLSSEPTRCLVILDTP